MKREALGNSADELSDEIRNGRWDHVANLRSVRVGDMKEITDELERRCPGHLLEEYKDAISRSMWINR